MMNKTRQAGQLTHILLDMMEETYTQYYFREYSSFHLIAYFF